jgi:predicted Zn-dependent protease with MMP-like domain
MDDRIFALCDEGLAAIDAGDLEAATVVWRRAAQIDAGDPEVLALAGEIASAEGRAEDALACFVRAMAADPEWPVPVLAAAQEERDRLDRPDDAARRLTKLASWPDPVVRAEALLELARTELVREKPKAVKTRLRELAAIGDGSKELAVDAGHIALAIEDAELAERFFSAALAIEEDDADALHGLGFVMRETGRKHEMERCWRRVRELDLARPRPPYALSDAEIDRIAHDALRELPEEIARALADVPVVIDDAPSHARIADGIDPRLLGLFEGTPLPNKSHLEGSPSSPDAAYVFVRNIENACASEEELREEVRITILHETAHYFGLEDEDLEAIGLG